MWKHIVTTEAIEHLCELPNAEEVASHDARDGSIWECDCGAQWQIRSEEIADGLGGPTWQLWQSAPGKLGALSAGDPLVEAFMVEHQKRVQKWEEERFTEWGAHHAPKAAEARARTLAMNNAPEREAAPEVSPKGRKRWFR